MKTPASPRRHFLKTAAGAAAVAAASRVSGGAIDRPNILWLVSEDNNPWLGCYGDAYADTPNLDRLASEGVLFTHAFANVPVCAPARFTIHSGTYAHAMGTQHMRSMEPIPAEVRFFPALLREAGYFCVNHFKTDYNIDATPKDAWDENGLRAHYKHRPPGRPFFAFFNYMTTHESSLHQSKKPIHDPALAPIAPYHPDLPDFRHDYAQYYDQITRFDRQAGEALAELEALGLAEDTIVIYFSDNGGVLPRSKRFLYDSGMSVPMIARFPAKYRHLAPGPPGSRVDDLVSFIDLAPTMLALAGLAAPDHMQGRAFMGPRPGPAPEYVYGFRDRMDERYDLSRAVRDQRYKYIRNYLPHLAWGRHLDYLWKMPSMRAWEQAYQRGELDEVQARFFGPKPVEELFDLEADPYEIYNLAEDPAHRDDLLRLRDENRRFLLSIRDAGFLHEGEMIARAAGSPPRDFLADPDAYDLEAIMATAEVAGEIAARVAAGALVNDDDVERILALLGDPDSGVRYWAAVGLSALADRVGSALVEWARPLPFLALTEPSATVRVQAAEALFKLDWEGENLGVFHDALLSKNPGVVLHAADALFNLGSPGGPSLQALARSAAGKVTRKTNLNAIR